MKRNSNYIIRIIIWSVVGLLSIGILVSAIVHGGFFGFVNSAFDWKESSMEVFKEQKFDSKDVKNINVEWISGTINIYPGDEEDIRIIEKKSGKIREEDALDVKIKNQTLYIKQKSVRKIFTFFSFGINNTERNIILPEKTYNAIRINGTSGKLTINNLGANEFNLKLTSGKIVTSNISSKDLSTELTSGAMDIKGEFEALAADVTSGSIALDLDKAPSKMVVKLTSGKAIISIPENQGFTLFETKTTGSFKSEFQVDDFGVYKNGKYQYSIKLTSGLVKLLRKSE